MLLKRYYAEIIFLSLILAVFSLYIMIWIYHWCPSGPPYWKNSTSGKVHMAGCQYYEKGKGKYVRTTFSGTACKKCFGLSRRGEKNGTL